MGSPLNASLLRLKLLDALRSGDTAKVDSVNETLLSTKSTTQTKDIIQIKHTILHYSVQVAPLSTIQYLVNNAQQFTVDINSQDQDGNTPLHLAAMTSRGEVVKYLLSLPNINDTTTNLDKKQPVELCKDLTIVQLMQYERAKFVEKSASQLREYFTKRDFKNLERLLVGNPRAAELLDINGADPETGNTVLHEFIAKGDLQMCDWILTHGGDPFKRDKRGKLPIDLIHNKSDPIRKLLKAASRDQTIMDPAMNPTSSKTVSAPTYKGYLKKWTNFASGYKLRYFVLDERGILSYYTNQDDTNNACRGSLNLGFASLHLDSSEKLKFEIIGKNGIRWHLRANHPIETNRWVWNLQNAITYAKDNLKKRGGRQVSSSNGSAPLSPSKRHLLSLRRKHKRTGSHVSLNSLDSKDEDSNSLSRSSTYKKSMDSPNLGKIYEKSTLKAPGGQFDQLSYVETDNENFDFDGDEEDDEDDDDDYYSEDGSMIKTPGNKNLSDEISTVKGSLEVEIRSLLDLFSNVLKSPESLDLEICKVGSNTLGVIQDLFSKYNGLISNKDAKNAKRFDRQLEVNKLWENSIRQLEKEIASREEKLAEFEGKKKQLKKYLTSKSSAGPSTPGSPPVTSALGAGTLASEGSSESRISMINASLNTGVSEQVIENLLNDSDDEFFDADELSESFDEELTEGQKQPESVRAETAVVSESQDAVSIESDTKTLSVDPKTFEENEVPKEQLNGVQQKHKQMVETEGSFLGYENPPRTKLKLDEDDRPKVGLWGILKSMIGKDMTRMTLPVSFNECTSLLQRLIEDVEYSDLLDHAATFEDSSLRTIYVAAFGASEYASTINRIAKPFNPLLGETFEYARPDKNYRVMTEQVSHHPPISACKAESIKWDYYGENAVDSKFRGRSFDFKHLGKMFCVIRPDAGVIDVNGNKVAEELYSWKKVNTSVVGIIVGNPTVDNFGEMEVTNHTTGDKIIVDLKQRGWRASSAYQLSGTVVDKDGNPKWAIGGHWNSKIFGKRLSQTNPNEEQRRASLVSKSDSTNNNFSKDPFSGGAFLIWQAAPRPKIPFNLTAFAVTLNGLDENLKKFVAPTDTRLRPDQRAMEDGQYDKASSEKHRVEEKQRAARKERELKRENYKPLWFVKRKHPVTGDAFWEFKGNYWQSRKEHKMENCPDIF
ncbi:hypothetical protein CANTEDRAFT_126281 [Yamadazyma tenuis ATCC 10573]|uniref:PH domain-containing protein n=1 Tax=Candida tenuis (strain ATCC 10573 / BCRC 21748 / CBS 615 / JCM 9827 / NBRC 10315 / NRRL Y-1498 / VKM Y-70) TaxID=590646 RepID=G3B8H8_CANTC|nr:uncharacterized protein CANTEDRAFT_126281 [Yamadazyma tenuis ATCC 10573]EGV62398.1 hypothetical protein CANTEDRAFT_126281 [Yamadazyma tenuis ATCC 10573]